MKIRYFLFNGGFLLLFTLFSFQARAQEQHGVRDKADKLFEQLQYAKASEIYLNLTDVLKPRYSDMKRLAVCYMNMNKYEDAEIWFSRVVANPNSVAEDLYDYGEMMKINANYSDAKDVFRDYMEKTGDEKRGLLNMAGCDSAEVWMSSPTGHVIKNEEAINTELSEFSVFPLVDKMVCFIGEPPLSKDKKTYGWTGSSFLRIFAAQKNDKNSLENRELSKSIYNDVYYHVGPLAANKEGSLFLITRTYPGKKGRITKINGNRYLTQNMELYLQSKKYGRWLAPQPFIYNDVKKYSLGHAVLSLDEKVMYYISDMKGGQGGTDIWYSEIQPNGTWSKPLNAGTTINTPGNEMFPTIGPDGTFYYSSNGFPGMGGLDIYSCNGERDQWSTPVNLRYPVNSSCDDFSYIVNENLKIGYLSSNRPNGKGGDDIYSFDIKLRNNLYTINGIAYNKQTKKRLADADVVIYSSKNTIVAKQKSGPDGSFSFKLPFTNLSNLKASKDGFYPDTAAVSKNAFSNDRKLNVALYLDPLFEKGKTFKLENIHYDFDKFNIRKDAEYILNGLLKIMHENPTLTIELASHTDSRGNDEYNMNLSQNRAQAAVDYLVSRGISRSRMEAKGYGESRLIYGKDGATITETQHQANRRTEFTVLSY